MGIVFRGAKSSDASSHPEAVVSARTVRKSGTGIRGKVVWGVGRVPGMADSCTIVGSLLGHGFRLLLLLLLLLVEEVEELREELGEAVEEVWDEWDE
jgi:hypothetical protein